MDIPPTPSLEDLSKDDTTLVSVIHLENVGGCPPYLSSTSTELSLVLAYLVMSLPYSPIIWVMSLTYLLMQRRFAMY